MSKRDGEVVLAKLLLCGARYSVQGAMAYIDGVMSKRYDVVDTVTGKYMVGAFVSPEGKVHTVHKQIFFNAVDSMGNSKARYQVVTEKIYKDYQAGKYIVDSTRQVLAERKDMGSRSKRLANKVAQRTKS